MKNILFILYFIIYSCTPAFGAATTTITADSIRSSNRTKTWTPPSITDVLTGLTDVQTLTNKTLTSPTINTPLVDVDTFTEQGSTPSTPDAGKRKVYAKADGIYHLDSAGNERKVGSGSGGGDVSYITNGNADDANASIFVPYADAAATRPVDGTGGSPTVTTSITSTAPLVGTKSYLLTKPASNVQGQGWAIPFTVDLGYRAKASKITVQYIVNSGTFVAGSDSTESDVIWYLYDVTNSVLSEPSNIKMRASSTTISDQYEAEFQTSATGSSYRLIAHVQSTSALAYELKVDEIKVSPNKAIYGTTGSDWQAYTPTVFGLGTVTIAESFWRRVGDSIQIRGRLTSGVPTAVAVSIDLPSGLSISNTKNTITSSYGQLVNNSLPGNFDLLATNNTTYVTVGNVGGSSGLSSALGTTVSGNTQAISWYSDPIPVQGWGSSQRISDGYDGRDLRVNVQRSASLTGINPNNSTVKIPIAPSIIDDSYAGWDAANNRILIKSSKTYDVSFSLGVDIANQVASNYISARVRKNGTTDIAVSNQQATGFYMGLIGSAVGVPLVAGDYLELFLNGTANNSASTLTVNSIVFNVSSRQSPQTISSVERISGLYNGSTASAVSTSYVTILYNTKIEDTHGLYNTSNGRITANTSGTINVTFQINSTYSAAAHDIILGVFKNGSVVHESLRTIQAGSGGNHQATFSVPVVAGDYLEMKAKLTSGSGNFGSSNTTSVMSFNYQK